MENNNIEKPNKAVANWCHVGVDIFHAHVLLCIGSRTDMMATGAQYMHEHSGWSDEKIDAVGKSLAKKLPYGEDKKIIGEVVRIDPDNGLIYFVRMDSFEPTPGDISVLCHECLHAAINILNDCGVKEEGGPDEVLCYVHEYIFKNALEQLSKDFSFLAKSYEKESDEGGEREEVETKTEAIENWWNRGRR